MIRSVNVLGPIIDTIEWIPPDKWPEPKSWTPKKVSASGIKNCSRQWYYSLSATPGGIEVRKPEWDLAAAQGTWAHDVIQQELLAKELIYQPETYLKSGDTFISGRIDGLLTGRDTLLEIKTMSSIYWRGVPDNSKFHSYSDQIQVYLELLDLPEALLVCVRREPLISGAKIRKTLAKEFLITRDREHGQRLIDKAENIRVAVENKIVPVAEPSEACYFCKWQQHCELQDVKDSIGVDQSHNLIKIKRSIDDCLEFD